MPAPPRRRATAATTKQVNFRLPRATHDRLNAVARVLGIPQSRIVDSALKVFFDGLPAKDQQFVESLLARKPKT
jgi:predicted DNA-binding protein